MSSSLAPTMGSVSEECFGSGTFGLTEVVAEDDVGRGGCEGGALVGGELGDVGGGDEKELDVLMMLDIERIPLLQREFERRGGELREEEFVHVMMGFLKLHGVRERSTALVTSLCDLFAQIDINGDGTMEWDEFLLHIVEKGRETEQTDPTSIHRYVGSAWRDAANHKGLIEDFYLFEGTGRIGVRESNSSSLHLFDCESLLHVSSLDASAEKLLCAVHIQDNGKYALSSTNREILIFDDHKLRLTKRIPVPTAQTCLEFSKSSGLLFSAGANGIVHGWDVENDKRRHSYEFGGVVHNEKGVFLVKNSHEDMVVDLLEIRSLECVASASMDSTIKLWDVIHGEFKRTLCGHQRGVRSLAHSDEFRVMVSAGFDHEAILWNPYVENYISKLKGHNAPLRKVRIVEGTPQIVTLDEAHELKIWDIRNFLCVQTIQMETNDNTCSFVALPELKKLVVGGQRMHLFEAEEVRYPHQTDDLHSSCAMLNVTMQQLLTASGKDVKLWDARTGTLLRRIRNISNSREISAVCLDDRQRKLVVGDVDGKISVFDFQTGMKMKTMVSHKSEISALLYCDVHKVVISSAWDDQILIHDELDPEEGLLLRTLRGGHGADISCLAYSASLNLVASGSPNATKNMITVWNFEFARIETILDPFPGRPKSICDLKFMDVHFPGLVVADDHVGITVFCLRPAKAEFRNAILAQKSLEGVAIQCLEMDQQNCKIFVADDEGRILVWSFEMLVERIEAVLGAFTAPSPCENARRKIYTEATRDQIESSRNMERKPLFSSEDSFVFVHKWQAHTAAIQSLRINFLHAPCLVTSGHDFQVKIFSLEGDPLGVLLQGEAFMGCDWHFTVDVEAISREKEQKAESLLEWIGDNGSSLLLDDQDGIEKEKCSANDPEILLDLSFLNIRRKDEEEAKNSRTTPRMVPVGAKLAGKGYTSSVKGRQRRSSLWQAKNSGIE